MKQNRILIISDLHMPNQHPSAIPFLEKLHKKWKFTKIFQIGDLVDFASVQVERPNDPEVESPVFEIGKATKEIRKLEKLFPEMDILKGNHDLRIERKAERFGIPRTMLKDLNEIFDIKAKWRWHDKFILTLPSKHKVFLTHNFKNNVLSSSKELGCSFISGHFHTQANIFWWSSPSALNFAMSTGCLINPKAPAMKYQKLFIKRPILSCGMLIEGIGPIIQPMYLNENGEWNGKV
jgi:predicted phosphodiesterase|tara:strand:- start:369 stop:1076 length:708 start_codon:yes stop_codon:yes gene_type:complete